MIKKGMTEKELARRKEFARKLQSMPRPIALMWCRGEHKKYMWKKPRHYKTTRYGAYPKALSVLMEEGHPGDVMEIFNTITSKQIGTITLFIGGRMDVKWNKKNE